MPEAEKRDRAQPPRVRKAVLLTTALAVLLVGRSSALAGDASGDVSLTFPTERTYNSYPLYPFGISTVERWLATTRHRFAADGAVEIHYSTGTDRVGWWFTPVSASDLCLLAYNDYVRAPNASSRSLVIKQAAGLLRRAERANGALIWRYGFANPPFRAKAGWLSGMGQGMAVGCLSAAWALSKNAVFAVGARAAFRPLVARFGNYGTAWPVGSGVFYEEVAGAGSFPAHVLNGHVYSLAGLWFADAITPSAAYRSALRRGIAGTRSIIDRFIRPGMSLYDLGLQGSAGITRYNRVHAEQMKWLGAVSGDPHFYEIAMRMLEFERPFPYTVQASATLNAARGVEHLAGAGGFYAGPLNKTVVLRVTFPAPVPVDEIRLISPRNAWMPAGITASAEGTRADLFPKSRFISLPFPSTVTSRIDIALRPRPGSLVALSLLAFSNPTHRSLNAVPGELSADYGWLALYDASPDTSWQSRAPDAWLLAELGEARYLQLEAKNCAPGWPTWWFSSDLHAWSRPLAVVGDRAAVPAGARYVLFRWAGTNGCLATLRGEIP